MLPIDIPAARYYISKTREFAYTPAVHLELEHSLMSISKWESTWHVSFFDIEQMTLRQFTDYVRCMTINRIKDPDVYRYLRESDFKKISDYMADPMSARVIRESKKKKKGPRRQTTSEYIYWLMTQYGIPYDCEKWHFNRLMALIDTFEANQGGEKPMTPAERRQFYNTLNESRKKEWGTKG